MIHFCQAIVTVGILKKKIRTSLERRKAKSKERKCEKEHGKNSGEVHHTIHVYADNYHLTLHHKRSLSNLLNMDLRYSMYEGGSWDRLNCF